MYKILVTDGGYSHTLEIIRSLSKKEIKLTVLAILLSHLFQKV